MAGEMHGIYKIRGGKESNTCKAKWRGVTCQESLNSPHNMITAVTNWHLVYVGVGVHVWVYTCGCTCVGVHVWVYMCGCTRVGVHVCVYMCVGVHVWVYM